MHNGVVANALSSNALARKNHRYILEPVEIFNIERLTSHPILTSFIKNIVLSSLVAVGVTIPG